MLADRLALPPQFPALDDHDAWKADIAEKDEQILLGIDARVAAINATVDETTICGIDVFVITTDGADPKETAPLLFDLHGAQCPVRRADPTRSWDCSIHHTSTLTL